MSISRSVLPCSERSLVMYRLLERLDDTKVGGRRVFQEAYLLMEPLTLTLVDVSLNNAPHIHCFWK